MKKPSSLISAILCFVLSIGLSSFLLGQSNPCGIEWMKYDYNSNGRYASVQQTREGEFIVVGWIFKGNFDIHVIKYDAHENSLTGWPRTYGGPGQDYGRAIIEIDDGYVIAGYTTQSGSAYTDILLLKIDINGNEIWQHTYGGAQNDYGYSVQPAEEGGYVIAGYTDTDPESGIQYDICLTKTDADGNLYWQKTFGGDRSDTSNFIQRTLDGGYIIIGTTQSYGAGNSDVYLIKTDADGNFKWENTFGGDYYDAGYSVQQTIPDGEYILVGYTNSFGLGRSDVYLVKTDSLGNLMWQRTFGGILDDFGYSVQQTADRGFVITGTTVSFARYPDNTFYRDVYFVRTDENGDLLGHQAFDLSKIEDAGNSVVQTSDLGFIIGGYQRKPNSSEYYGFILKLPACIPVNQPPHARINPISGSPREGSTINFRDYSVDSDFDLVSWLWDFGDGDSSNQRIVSHVYRNNGDYTVSLTVTDFTGKSDTETIELKVVNAAPIADARIDDDTNKYPYKNEGDVLQLNGGASDPGLDDILTFEWDLDGDGIYGDLTGPDPQWILTDDFYISHTISLRVTDNDGGIGTDTAVVIVGNVVPSVEAGANQEVNEGDTVAFNGFFTDPGTADTHTVEWTFGDSSITSETLSPSHAYGDNGEFQVTLTVTDDDHDLEKQINGIGSDNLTVTVNNVAPVVIAGQDREANPCESIHFAGFYSDPGWLDTHTILWDFGDGSTEAGILTPAHSYKEIGEYIVTLTVMDDDGGVGMSTLKVTVRNPLEALQYFIDKINSLSSPDKAQKELEHAVKDLDKAIYEINKGKGQKLIEHIAKAVKHLEKTLKYGAEPQETIDEFIAYVECLVNDAIDEAVNLVGADHHDVLKAFEFRDKAVKYLSEAKYEKAVKEYHNAYKEAFKAMGKWMPEALDEKITDVIGEVDELLADDELSKKARDGIKKAKEELVKAFDYAEKGDGKKALDQIEKAIKELEKAQKNGADTSSIIDSLQDILEEWSI